MTAYIVFQPATGPICVHCIADGVDLASAAKSAVPDGLEYFEVEKEYLDAFYESYGQIRSSWRMGAGGGTIVFDRKEAELSTIDRLRVEREPRLAELDVQFMRAIEQGQDTTAIVAEKQALRDVTSKPLDGLSLDELASLTLDGALKL